MTVKIVAAQLVEFARQEDALLREGACFQVTFLTIIHTVVPFMHKPCGYLLLLLG